MVSVQAVIAANRFGLGTRPGELDEISQDHEGWLLAQLSPNARPVRSSLAGSGEILSEFQRLQRVRNEARRNEARRDDSAERGEDAARAFRTFIRSRYQAQVTRRYELSAATDVPFRERLVHFGPITLRSPRTNGPSRLW